MTDTVTSFAEVELSQREKLIGEETVTVFVWMNAWYSNFNSLFVRFEAVVDPEGRSGVRERDWG